MKNSIRQVLGISFLLVTFHAPATTRYVDLNSPNATPPFTDWTTAATNIQDAVDAAVDGDLVLVTNGVYATGGVVVTGSLSSRVAVTRAVTVQSVNGPTVTVIKGFQIPGTKNGDGAVRCVYLTNNAALIGFTLTNGATRGGAATSNERQGGGVFCRSSAVVSNCIIVGNTADRSGGGAIAGKLYDCIIKGNSATNGGGALGSVLNNCLVLSNTCQGFGGGAWGCSLISCTISANSALFGGGVNTDLSPPVSIVNCIIYDNSVIGGGLGSNHYGSAGMTNCCISPLAFGSGNFTNTPLLVDLLNGDYHLQPNSPCINAGNNSYATTSTDLDGNPRIAGGTVDIGAYEFQSPSSVLSYAWAQQYGLPTDGSADFTDPDGDGLNNWQEWMAGTTPTNSLSVLKMFSPSNNVPGLKVSWQSVSGKIYFLQRSTNLLAQPAFSSIKSNLTGAATTTTYSDITATNGGPYFYRIGVQ